MQFTTVRSKEKKLCHLFNVRNTGSQQLETRKQCYPAIWKCKKLVPSYFESDKHCCSYLAREKSGSLLVGDQKIQFTTVRSKEKDYDFCLKSEKTVHSQQEHEKNVSQLFGSGKKLVPSYFEPDKHSCIYLEREKSGSLLFGDQKMQFTTVRSKEKDYDIYLESEKLVHSKQEQEKHVSLLFGSGKSCFLAISSLTNPVASICREKIVDHFYLETKKCTSQLLGARKKIMTCI